MEIKKELAELADRIKSGDRGALARGITLVESVRPEDQTSALTLLAGLAAAESDSVRLAVTGPPGAGKSTLIDALGMQLLERGHRIAVLTIDPSSPVSGGSILGDKTRMGSLVQSDQAFIRPTPSAGMSGGVSHRTREVLTLFEAAGYDFIFIETVGVGQSEYSVRELVDEMLLVLIPGSGDSLQGLKRGILELAELIVVNKADGPNRDAARQAVQDLEAAIRLFESEGQSWRTFIRTCSAHTGEGIGDLVDGIFAYTKFLKGTGAWEANRRKQCVDWLHAETLRKFRQRQDGWTLWEERLRAEERKLNAGQINEYAALAEMLA